MIICQRCQKRPAEIQTTQTIEGRQVYVALCRICFDDLQKSATETSILDKFGKDLTQLARDDKLDPVIGREEEIKRVIHILSRRTKNNPVLIGDPGVGKTAIVEGLAQKIASGQVPETLQGKRVVALDMASIVAGTSHRGQFEDRLKKILDEVIKAQGQIILFMDELHTVVGAGAAEGAIDAANMLKPSLARGELQLVGATTLDEYRKRIEKDAALERRFQPVIVSEPSFTETIAILNGLKQRYEKHHQVFYSEEAIKAAVEFSDRYISDRFLPDKAIDLIDEAGAEVRLGAVREPENLKQVEREIVELKKELAKEGSDKSKTNTKLEELNKVKKELMEIWTKTKLEEIPVVKREDIARIVSRATRIPLEELTMEEREKLLHLEDRIHNRIVDQEEAVKVVSAAIRRARVGLKDPKRPIGSFIFLGPTGVGKSELTKALSEVLYGDEDLMVRLDMSEYMEKHTVSRMIGSPPGYVGYDEAGQLTEIVRRKPFSVILFDELEKAHPEVFNILLQIMEDGRLTDSHGRAVDFKNTILVMTSNVGSDVINKTAQLGFSKDSSKDTNIKEARESYGTLKEKLLGVLKGAFKPEFLNRVDEIVVFKPLGRAEIRKIVDLQLIKTEKLLKEQNLSMEVSIKARDYIAKEGFDPNLGARPIRRFIQNQLENRISEKVINGEFLENSVAIVDVKNGKLDITIKTKVPAKV
ncbi:MAG: AAA family ATPase [bacterium]